MFDRIQVVRFAVLLAAIVSLALTVPARPRALEPGAEARKLKVGGVPAKPAQLRTHAADEDADAMHASSGHMPEAMNVELPQASAALGAASKRASHLLAVVTASRSLRVAGVQR